MFDIDTTVELISLAASNSLFVFCFCNLIIAIILVGSRPNSGFDGGRVLVSTPTCKSNAGETPPEAEAPSNNREEMPAAEHEEVHSQCSVPIEDESCDRQERRDDEDGEDDDLRTRIEDFIAKVNREWHAEKLRAKAGS